MQAFVTLSLSIVKDKRPIALTAKVDTGAQANILPWRIYQQMDLPENSLKPSTTTLVSYTGTPISAAYPARSKARQKSPTFLSLKHWDLRLPDFRHWRNSDSSRNCGITKELPCIKNNADLIRQYPECFSRHREVRRTVPHHRPPRSTASRTPTTVSPVQNEGGD